MRILFLTHYFPPEVNAPATRTLEHCRAWVRAGHEVHVVTCVPSHPRGVPFAGYRPAWYRRDEVEGIHVHRVWTLLAPNKGALRRIANYLSFVPTAVFRSLRIGRFDILIATSPQFFCAVAGWISASLKRTPWVFELRDLWPDSIAAVGAMRRSVALRLLERLELHLYRSAARVVCVTRSFVSNLARRGIDGAKLRFVPNGIEPGFWREGRPEGARESLGITDGELVASFVGTVGMAHGLSTLLSAAEILAARGVRLKLLVVGDGAERANIEAEMHRRGLENVRFTGLVPREEARDILRASDIAMVLLRRSDVFETVIPSKMLEAFAAGCPVVLGVKGEAKRILEEAGAGIAVEPEDAEGLAAALAKMANEPERRKGMGVAGRLFVEREYNREKWATEYLEMIEEAAQ